MDQPSSVTNAVRLMWLGALLAVVTLVLIPIQKDTIREEAERSANAFSDVDTVVNIAVGFGMVFYAVAAGLWIWMAVMNDKPGKNWARILATVLGGVWLVFGLLGLIAGAVFGGEQAVNTIILVITLIIAVTAIVFMWQKPSSRWYSLKA